MSIRDPVDEYAKTREWDRERGRDDGPER